MGLNAINATLTARSNLTGGKTLSAAEIKAIET
jgi:hypothetical protein